MRMGLEPIGLKPVPTFSLFAAARKQTQRPVRETG